MDPAHLNTYPCGHIERYDDKFRSNGEGRYLPRTDPVTKRTIVWEPYAVRDTRVSVTTDEIIQNRNKRINKEDWMQAYGTYSPYRTTNQEYGPRKTNIHFIPNIYPNQTSGYSQVPADPRQYSVNPHTAGPGFSTSSALPFSFPKGSSQPAYGTPKPAQFM